MTDEVKQPETPKHSEAWQFTRHEVYVLWCKWWPVAALSLCDILSQRASELQSSTTASVVRIGVILTMGVSIFRVWAQNNKNKQIN